MAKSLAATCGLPPGPRWIRDSRVISSGVAEARSSRPRAWKEKWTMIPPATRNRIPSRDMAVVFSCRFCRSPRQHGRHAAVEQVEHLVDLFRRHDQGRAEGQPVRVEAAQQAQLQRPAADAHADLLAGGEALLRLHVLDEFDPLQEALAADVADDAMLAGEPLEAGAEALALGPGVAAQVALQNLAQDGDAGGAGDRVALEGVALDEAGVVLDRPPEDVADRLPADHRRQRRESAAEALGSTQDVGHHAEGLGREQVARPAGAGDDLVEDEQHVVAVADLAEDRQVLRRRVDDPAG